MSDQQEPAPQEDGKPTEAKEMFLGKIKITDGRSLSYCEWTVVGAGGQWRYSAVMPLKGGAKHRISMGTDAGGKFVYEIQTDDRDAACAAVKERVLAFLKKQPRWRVIETG
jgi:hypothetical protein